MTETKRLGRGLEALLGPVSREQADASGALRELPIAQVHPNPYQPRTRIDEPALAELAESMEASGLLQPVVVRSQGGAYELIAGERRWRAAQRLGWTKIPAVVKEVDDQHPADAGPDREPPARRSLTDRRGRRLPSPGGGVPLGHAEIARVVGGTARPSPTCFACCSCRTRCRPCCTTAGWGRATPARSWA